jgi:hypothetical protein
VWVFDVAWALAVFFGLRSLAARLLGVRIGPVAAIVCGAFGVAAGLGLQRAADGDASGVAPYAIFAVLSLMATMDVVALLGLTLDEVNAIPSCFQTTLRRAASADSSLRIR